MSRYRSRMGNDRKARREIGRRLRKGGVMMCMMITSSMLLSACSGGNSSSKNTTAAQTTEAAAEGGVQDSQNEVMGRVKLVSDTEITVEQGPGGAPGQNSDGQQPGGAPGQDGDNQQPSGAPDGQNQPPQGGVPEGKGQPPQGKTTTYKITTSTTFTDADGALIQVSDIKDGDFVKITTDGNGTAVQISLADMPGGPDGPQGGPENGAPGTDGPGGGAQSAPASYSSVKEFTSDTEETGQSYISEGTDESAVLVSDGANVTLKDFTVNRTSEDSKGGDSSSFYGVGASVLATDVMFGDASAVDTGAREALAGQEGRYDIGQPGDLGSADDKVIACSVVTDNAALVKTCMEDIENGTFGNKTVYGDLSNGCLSVGTFSSVVPEDIQKQYLEVVDQIKAGTFLN